MLTEYLVLNIFLSLALAILASAVYAYMNDHFNTKRLKRIYGRMQGLFDGFNYDEKNPGTLKTKPISEANIKYLAENRLEIRVTHGKEKTVEWAGEITLHTQKHGLVVWQYTHEEYKHFFGYKRCIIQDDETLILIGDPSGGYGNEIFKRKQKPY